MSEKLINKVVYGNNVLIDLTDASVSGSSDADKILASNTAYGADGSLVTGTCDFDVNSSVATANVSEVLSGKTFAQGGSIKTGTMVNRGSISESIDTLSEEITISAGFHDGGGKVGIASLEKAKVIPTNIKAGISILGIVGTYSGEAIKVTTKTATPYTTAKTYLPSQDGDYDYYSQVTINAISYVETENAFGGITATIGDVAPTA